MFFAQANHLVLLSDKTDTSLNSETKFNSVHYKREEAVKMTQREAGSLFDSAELNKTMQTFNSKLREVQKKGIQPTTSEIVVNEKISTPPPLQTTQSPISETTSPPFQTTSPPKRKRRQRYQKQPKPEDNPNYSIAMSRRRNYTDHHPYNSKEFKQESISRLNPSSHGLCEQDRCLKYVAGQEVPFDYSTECTLHFQFQCRGISS